MNEANQDKTIIQSYSSRENKLYGYMTPEIKNREGYVKVGQTSKDVDKRIKEQLGTIGLNYELLWQRLAQRNDKTWFSDRDLHRYYIEKGVDRVKFKGAGSSAKEWFDFGDRPERSEELADEYIAIDRYFIPKEEKISYTLRPEQEKAVDASLAYYYSSKGQAKREFLWNAKPRFGKTLTSYDFMRMIEANNTLIVTNRPAIANSWLDDFNKFIGWQVANLYFISDTDALKGKSLTREEFVRDILPENNEAGMVAFVSLQDLKGAKIFGGDFAKLEWIAATKWKLLIIDEAHEGVDTIKTDKAFDKIDRDFTLHLSGTPFKALAEEKFDQDQIYNWTYLDEQSAKAGWDEKYIDTNPYADLPELSLFTYQMSDLIIDEIDKGKDLSQSVNVDYAFDLNEFFSTDEAGKFIYEEDVLSFLDNLSSGHMPFSEEKHRDELKHSFWLLPGVASAKALEKLLKNHPVFEEYEIVLAAGDGKSLVEENFESTDQIIEEEAHDGKGNMKAYDRVKEAIKGHDKTITLSCGQLTTGVTIPQWTGVLMLNNITSPALYFQAAFRAQNPHNYTDQEGNLLRKERAYVFDFSPDRTLQLYDEFANNLSANTKKISHEERKENIKILLNFFPVIGEDEEGQMVQLDVNEVLVRPNIIRAKEVVRNGFMSNLLFKNIGNIFRAPQEVRDILNELPIEKNKNSLSIDEPIQKQNPMVDDDGKPDIGEDIIQDKTQGIFGNKVYFTIDPEEEKSPNKILNKIMDQISIPSSEDKYKEEFNLKDGAIKKDKKKFKGSLKDTVHEEYGKYSQEEKRLKDEYDNKIKESKLKRDEEISLAKSQEEKEKIEERYREELKIAEEEKAKGQEEAKEEFNTNLIDKADELRTDTVGSRIEKEERKKKNTEESDVRDRLRGFTRTIPSALMAYGDRDTTIGNFEEKIPDESFFELTSISKEAFRLLRDGWDKVDQEGNPILDGQGNPVHADGFFNKSVFNAAIGEFFDKKDELSDYWQDEKNRTIFDYIPLQETNQKFTPVDYVRLMVNALEEENPDIYSDPHIKFLDPYAKSGLFISEIGRRLFQGLEEEIPDEGERLKHIFEDQLYALAPTEIIYNIAKSHIYDKLDDISTDNLVKYDLTEDVKDEKMGEKLNEIFGEGKEVEFDVIIGNPPYQEEAKGTSTKDHPIYNRFIDESYKIASKVIYITPARFLFNAGATSKKWNKKC